jgi:integrase
MREIRTTANEIQQATPQHYIAAATSENTRKTYQSAVRRVQQWGLKLPCSEEHILTYLTENAQTLNPRSLSLHLSALSQWHISQGFNDPTQSLLVKKTMKGIQRKHGKPKQKAKALRLEHIATLLKTLQAKPDSKKKARDIALILSAFFGAFRRSELVSIHYEDIEWHSDGIVITLPRSKTDQEGDGMRRAIPYSSSMACAASALTRWVNISGITSGTLFTSINRWDQLGDKPLNPSSINQILKALGRESGFDFIPMLSSHSFRRGLSTSAAREKVDFELIKKQGGWKNDTTVWEYIDEGQQFTDNASLPLMDKMDALLK